MEKSIVKLNNYKFGFAIPSCKFNRNNLTYCKTVELGLYFELYLLWIVKRSAL